MYNEEFQGTMWKGSINKTLCWMIICGGCKYELKNKIYLRSNYDIISYYWLNELIMA